MTRTEAALALAYAAAFDRRTVGVTDAEAWAEALSGISLDDAKAAIAEHYGASTDYLMPAHIRAIVKAKRAARPDVQTVDEALRIPDADASDPRAYIAALREHRFQPERAPAVDPDEVRRAIGGAFGGET